MAQMIRNNFRFNMIWYTQTTATHVLCWEASRTWCHCHVISHVYELLIGDIITRLIQFPPSITLAFVTKMNEKHKSTLPSTNQVKNWWNTISTEEELEVINWHEEFERIIDIYHNVRLAHSSACTINDNADRITGSAAKSGTKVFV